VKHEPCGFLSHIQGAGISHAADAVLRSNDQPHCRKPLFKAKRRILEDGSHLGRKLAFRMGALALPLPLTGKPSNILPPASGANNAIRPAMGDHVGNAVIGIGEVNDGFLKCLWRSHVLRILYYQDTKVEGKNCQLS
jgi:hypothetical protein